MISHKKTTLLFALVVTTLLGSLLTSCKGKDADKIGDAQFCLDNATKENVSECVQKVEGLETPGAYLIRCVANFVQEDFGDPKAIVDVFKSLDNGTSNGTTTFLAALSFSSLASATTTYDNCVKSKQKGLSLIAAMVKSATTIASLGLASLPANPTQTDINNAINNLLTSSPNKEAAAEAIGTTITTVYETTCQTGSQTNATLCSQLDAAYASAPSMTPAEIGAAILAQWQNH